MNELTQHIEQGEIILYQPDETIRLEVRLEGETVWLTQVQMAELFGRERSVIAKHIGNCFREGELQAEEVCAKFAQLVGVRLPGGLQRKKIKN